MSVSVTVVDCFYGRPVIGMSVRLDRDIDGSWIEQMRNQTGNDGCICEWSNSPLARGLYRLEFDLDGYFTSLGIAPLYPVVTIRFRIPDPNHLCHISLLITPSAYFTYQQNCHADQHEQQRGGRPGQYRDRRRDGSEAT
jgi:5-hydroxyisourate hydrolase